MSIQKWKITEPFVRISCSLGEGPYWSEQGKYLRFLDINNCKLYIVKPDEGPQSLIEIDTGVPIGSTADIEGVDPTETILVGAKDGVAKFHLKTGKHESVAKYWSGPGAEEKARIFRSNDGNVDTQGRFWTEAFMDPEIQDPEPVGVLFRLDPDGTLKEIHGEMVIPNGITWNAQDNVMLLTDTTINTIWAFDYDPESGQVSHRRRFFEWQGDGHPDGHTIDEQGNIWHAIYGGSKVIRISSAGEVTGEIELPTRNITCPVFMGTELFITSAKEDEPEKHPSSAKFAGSLFRIDVGVRGALKHRAKSP